MWKSFIYKNVKRVAWIAPKGPAYQVKPEQGFRSFNPERMLKIHWTWPRAINRNIIDKYPELRKASFKSWLFSFISTNGLKLLSNPRTTEN